MARRKKRRSLLYRWKHFSEKKKRRLIFKFVAWLLSIVADCLIAYALNKVLSLAGIVMTAITIKLTVSMKKDFKSDND